VRRPVRVMAGRLATRGTAAPVKIADGVWRMHANPGRLNLFFLEEEGGGTTLFDAGGQVMLPQVGAAASALALRRVVLSHAHTDHRGTAPHLGVPVLCHQDERADVEGSGGLRYWGAGLPKLPFAPRMLHRYVLQPLYDGGPVEVSATLEEGDRVAGFRVVHLPGHAPGLIALVRDADGLALTSDAFYTVDTWWRDCRPYLPSAAWSWDVERSADSLRRLASLDLSVAWPGHGEPVRGNLAAQLEHAVESRARSDAPSRAPGT
jgi:hydroxyacylglutathione hydrolase